MRRPGTALGIVAGLGLTLLASSRVRETALGFVNNYASRYTQTFATADRTHAARTSTAVAAADAVNAPAGGAGAAAGAWDTAANRDAAIAVINSLVTLANEIKADFNLLRADVDDTAQVVNAVVDDLQAFKIVG